METSTIVERDFTALGMLFNLVINDMKNGTPVWEDFILKATKLHTQLKSTVLASTAFLDSFQKIADMATSARGGTKDIGSALTRLCLRQRSVESHLKTFTSSIMDCLILPLQDRLEEWKKINTQLDKEHSKEYKKYRQELKKRSTETSNSNNFSGQNLMAYKDGQKEGIYQSQQTMATLKLHKKLRLSSVSNNQPEPIYASMDFNDKLIHFEQMEKNAVRRALIEERSRYCLFVSYLKNIVEEELSITQETSHLQEVMESLNKLTTDPYNLPPSSELVISDLKLGASKTSTLTNGTYNAYKEKNSIYASTQQLKQQQLSQNHQAIYGQIISQQQQNLHQQPQNIQNPVPNHLNQTPPSSPSSFSSRKSSMCSISSFNSSSSGSTHSPSSLYHLKNHHHHHLHHLHHIQNFNNNINNSANTRYQSQNNLPNRIPSIASHDSGFMSNADTCSLNQVPSLMEHQSSNLSNNSTSLSLISRECMNKEQNDLNNGQFSKSHTISTSYEKKRPSLNMDTFDYIKSKDEKIYDKISDTNNFNVKMNQCKENTNILESINSSGCHSTLIKVETNSTVNKPINCYEHQKKLITDLDNVILGNQNISNYNTLNSLNKNNNFPPTPPLRKVSLQVEEKDMSNKTDNKSQADTKNDIATNTLNEDNVTICSEGSITPTNPVSKENNIYKTISIDNNEEKTIYSNNKKIDEMSATLTRQNSKNSKLSTSLKSIVFPELSLNNQLSLTNLSNNNLNKAAPPPPIRRTSSISNPNAITLGTLRSAGVSTYEEIKNLTLTNLHRFKKNTTNYATYEDVSRLGINLNNQSNECFDNSQNIPSSHYSTYSNNNSDHYHSQYGMNYNTYAGNRNPRINSCTNLMNNNLEVYNDFNKNIYSEVNISSNNLNQEKSINQLRSEYQQAKHLFENLESNQQNKILLENQIYTDLQSSTNKKSKPSNNLDLDKMSSEKSYQVSSFSNQVSGHISRISNVKKEFIESLNAKLSSPSCKSSPKVQKRRSLSIGHDSEYDFELNGTKSNQNGNDSKNKFNQSQNQNNSGHFSLQQSLIRLVTSNYAKITRSPEPTRKNYSTNSQITNYQPSNLMTNSFQSCLSTNNLFNNTTQNSSLIGSEVAKEVASIAIKKIQNSYPTSCRNFEVLSKNNQNNEKNDEESMYSSNNLIKKNINHTTTIQVETNNNLNPQNVKLNNFNDQKNFCGNNLNSKNLTNNQRRLSQPSMGVKIVTSNRQNQQVQQNFKPNQELMNNTLNQMNQLNLNDKQNKSNKYSNDRYLVDELKAKNENLYNQNSQITKDSNQVTERVESWLNKSNSNENCRESLLDQIRKGTQLRKVDKRNDRSAPKI